MVIEVQPGLVNPALLQSLALKGSPFGIGLAAYKKETKNAKLVRINCAGERFVTTEQSLSHYPDTLLGDPKV